MKAKTEPLKPMPEILVPEFEEWVAGRGRDPNSTPEADLASLIAVYEAGAIGPQICAGMFRLSAEQRNTVRERAVELIRVEVDGALRWEAEVDGVAWHTDGNRLWSELPCRDRGDEVSGPAEEPFALEARKVKRRRGR